MVAAATQHPETKVFQQRVKYFDGRISGSAVVGLDTFIKDHYSQGFRSLEGGYNYIEYVLPAVTVDSKGAQLWLWYKDGPGYLENFYYSYTPEWGIHIPSGRVEPLQVKTDEIDIFNNIFGVYLTYQHQSNGYVGSINSAWNDIGGRNDRWNFHLYYFDDAMMYFDSGSSKTARVRAPITGGDNKGLCVGCRENSNMFLQLNGTTLAVKGDAYEGKLKGGQRIELKTDSGGIWFSGIFLGKSIEMMNASRLGSIWNKLQSSVDPNRGF